jgi:hypothetical protein
VLGIIGWSIATKVRTGSGLPAGPSGLLGAVEGVSYLSLLGGETRAGQQQQGGDCSTAGSSDASSSTNSYQLPPAGSCAMCQVAATWDNVQITQQQQQQPK